MKSIFTLYIALIACIACAQKKEKTFTSPEGYDFNQPEKITLPHMLQEISGITFKDGEPHTLFAQQDEKGSLFYFNPDATKDMKAVTFGPEGDYEDLALTGKWVILLRSDGSFFTFPFSSTYPEQITAVKTEKLLPKGEYESLATGDDQKLYALCKQCAVDKDGKQTTGYTLQVSPNGTISQLTSFSIPTKNIKNVVSFKGKAFRPSALTKHPTNNEWYILSSINKLLVITDFSWKVKAAYALNPKLFNQPEGIAFDKQHNLYISNEAGNKGNATLLKFSYRKNK
ncbi:hypothetical protein GCM10023231_30460 [Olivibacter ginsenosidimutans]|uniref:SdiA-regulated family protein n=1 Tax=Olivibacter ginsenosidimutans TaxID=1176537 RepID=A0ABP9BTX5_9SPHI